MSKESSESVEEVEWTCKFLQNKYIVLKKIGFGSYASVWMCYDLNESKYCAIKISNKDEYKTCIKETKVYNQIKKFNCEYIMDLKCTFDTKEDDELYHCEVMDLMGDSLYKYVKYNGPIKLKTVIDLTKQILIALSTLHANNIIHGDLKPENILLANKSKNTNIFIQKMNIEKIIKNKNLMKDQKSRKKILEEIKKHIDNIDINLEYDSLDTISSVEDSNDSDSDSNDSNICSEDSVSITYSLESSSDGDDLSNHSYDNNNNNLNNEIIFSIKIADMGGCVLPDQKRKKQIQTCYYMPPEVLLRLPYNNTSDMWALACSLYEIITGKILFDPDDYDGNEDRFHLYLMSNSLGKIPDEIINESRYKDIFFTQNYKRIRGFEKFEQCDLKIKICEKIKYDSFDLDEKIITDKFLAFFFQCLEYDTNKRISSIDALKLDIFM